MTTTPWLPADWQHPTRVELPTGHHLRPIHPDDTALDLPAVRGSRERLWTVYGEAWGWPPAHLSAEQDRDDLQHHREEELAHASFNYALFDADETELVGCVYIDPTDKLDPDNPNADADISWWVRDEALGTPVEAALDAFVPAWIASTWPLRAPRYVGRDLTWARWIALPRTGDRSGRRGQDESVSAILVVVDVQNDYFPGGAHPLVEPEAAAAVVARTLDAFRRTGNPVVHVRHQWDDPEAPYLRAGSTGGEIHASVAPVEGEPVLDKEFPNAFLQTDLAERIAASGAEKVVVVGMMTNMCIDATVREAVDRELDTVVVADGCAASELTWGDRTVDGATVHTAFVAALADAGATVVTGAEVDSLLAG